MDEQDAEWQRRFVADEPRLSEAVQAYQELGFEVRVVPLEQEGQPCDACFSGEVGRYGVIYTRRPPP